MDKDKSVFYLRICAFCCIGMLAVLVVCAVLLVPEAQNALRAVTDTAERMKDVNWTELTQAMTSGLNSAAKTLDGVDIDTLNRTIRDLESIIEMLLSLFQ